MLPSSCNTSQITPAGASPAMRARSTAASVWPARCRTPPLTALSGNVCPGETKSSSELEGSTSFSTVSDRSCALIPVVVPFLASTDSMNAVPKPSPSPRTDIGDRFSAWRRSCSNATQIRPRPNFVMKLMASSEIFSAATMRSPSFSRFSSSVTIIISPRFTAASTSSIGSNDILHFPWQSDLGKDHGGRDTGSAPIAARRGTGRYTRAAYVLSHPDFGAPTPLLSVTEFHRTSPAIAGVADYNRRSGFFRPQAGTTLSRRQSLL